MSELAQKVWEEKYRDKDEKSPEETYKRVCDAIMPEMYQDMCDNKFMPGGRILAGAGIDKKVTLANCFVLAIKDDTIESIFECARDAASTYKTGGGVGCCLSTLRPRGSTVHNAAKTSTGAVSFMELFDTTTKVIGGHGRRGALMLSLHVNHPDIMEFICVKDDEAKTSITNANISVMLSDEFMVAVEEDAEIELWYPELYPRTPDEYEVLPNISNCYDSEYDCFCVNGEYRHKVVYKTIKATEIWEAITLRAWASAEPGVLFWSSMIEDNSTQSILPLSSTNPCSEQPLPEFGACTLGSINLAAFVTGKFIKPHFDYADFDRVIALGVEFLDNTLDITDNPLKEQAKLMQDYRRIGLGITGLAHCLAYLKIKYDSDTAINFVREIGKRLERVAYQTSHKLAKERGAYLEFNGEYEGHLAKVVNEGILDYDELQKYGIRNSCLLTVAPSGTISLLMDSSYGIEPIYELAFVRNSESLSQSTFEVTDRAYEEYKQITGKSDVPDYFVTAYEVCAEKKVELQGVLQEYIDSSISITTNLPKDATVEDVAKIYKLAWETGCKGHTVYREGSRSAVLETNSSSLIRDSHEVLEGKTIVIPSRDGKVYLTVNTHPITEKPVEVFLSSAKSGSDVKAIYEGYGRVISLHLQNGGDIADIISTLLDINGKDTYFAKGWTLNSLPDLIAKGLLKLSDSVSIKLPCPDCGSEITMTSGCMVCSNCGYSKC